MSGVYGSNKYIIKIKFTCFFYLKNYICGLLTFHLYSADLGDNREAKAGL